MLAETKQLTSNVPLAGFGAQAATTSPFGAKPAFGAPAANTGGSLFGGTANNTSSGGFGGFGSTNNNTATNSGFGAPSGGFGSNTATTGFGGTATGGGGLFGNNNSSTASTGFGGSGTTSGFGQAASTGFGATNNNNAQNTGTGGTPFTEHNEKDQTQTNKYQSIACLPAYQNWSFEELRTVDYAQGRKTGNSNGQAGAFGTSTGFGGFGSTNNAASGGFGSNTGGGFGSTANAGNSIFGGAKPNGFGTPAAATTSPFGGTTNNTSGGLFGQPANNSASGGFGTNTSSGFGSTAGGGLFGNKPNTTGGMFGSTPAATSNTGGGIFGNANTTATSGFGASTNAFGSTNTSGGFGQPAANNNTGGGLFGNTANNNTATAGAFGGGFGNNNQTNNQTQNSNPFGGFGNNNANQNKPQAFGAPTNTTGGGLFGQPPATQQTNSLFGGAQNNNTQGNSLFGNKPQTTGNSLFGNTQTNNTGGGLFGSTQNNNNNQGSSLFGPKPQTAGGGMFGSTTNNSTGGGIFGSSLGGNNSNQQQGGGMFGNTQNQQSSFGGNSLFGGSIAGQQQPQQLSTSIMANNPYGNEHLFANLGTPQQAVGPLATPLSSSQKARKPAPLPTYKLNPSASSRLITPQKRSGYGFEYSNYGTPGSAYSNASSPMYGGSLLSNSRLGSTLTRSLSSSTLGRSSISPSESILNPNAFSSGGFRGSTGGSLKKLRINRNLRTDLFGTAESAPESRTSPLKKTVTFGGEEHENGATNGETSNALVRVQSDGESSMPSAEEQGYLRSNGSRPAPRSNGSSEQPEMQQVNGKELAVVPENASLPSSALAKTSSSSNVPMSQEDQEPGEYFTIPGLDEISKMSRQDKSKLKSFIVGREGCGQIEFHNVDLTSVDLDDIIGDIVRIETRSATVYVDHADKPPVGKGLNIHSTVTLKNSWPRTKGGKQQVLERKGPRFEKHLQRLQRVEGTEFVEYRAETGEWVFAVEHFSTYALDYSDDNDSIMSSPVHTSAAENAQNPHEDTSMVSNASSAQDSNVDDTFEFRSSRALPGAFDEDASMYDDMIGNSAVHAGQHNVDSDDEGVVHGHGMNGRRDSSVFDDTAPLDEHDETDFEKHSPNFAASLKPKSILKASTGFRTSFGGTPSSKPVIGADWASQLQRTLSPKKQDRQALRESQGFFANTPFTQSTRARPQVNFAASTKPTHEAEIGNSIDLMNSLFGNSTARTGPISAPKSARSNGFQV
jgi:nuclear pore complex protein Nup98-Nup96